MSRLTTRARHRTRACVLGVVALAAVAWSRRQAMAAPSRVAVEPDEQHLRQVARVRAGRGGPRAPGGLQRIADANGGHRFSGFAGYNASVDYVVRTLRAAGYAPVVQAFDYLAYEVVGPSALQQVAPTARTYVEGVDFGAITQSDPGDVTAAVTAVDLALGLGNASTSGCEAADWVDFPDGNIALLQRGTCTLSSRPRTPQQPAPAGS